jgi:hypothetical protein
VCITEPGTYTVEMKETSGSVSVKRLTLGGTAGTQTLAVESTGSDNAVLTTTEGLIVGEHGAVTMTNGDGSGNSVTLVGSITNGGTLTTELANGGSRTIQGSVTNKGTVQINTSTSFSGEKAALTNEGVLNVASGKVLTLSNKSSFLNGTGGSIAAASSTADVLAGSGTTFTEGNGKTSGTQPVIVDDAALSYTGTGESTIALRGTSTLSGTINAGQVLSIQSTGSENAHTTATSFLNSGTIDLTNGDSSGNNAILGLGVGTLTNKGTIDIEFPEGGLREIEGSLKNEKILSIGAGTLKVTGTYTQTGAGTFSVAVASSSSFGVLSVTGTAKIAGALAVTDVAPFVGKAGESLAVLSSSSRTGTFSKETGAVVKSVAGLYYKPTYFAKEVTLLVTQATLSLSSTKGLPGSVVTISGSDYLPNDTITLSFMDRGVKTVFPSVKTESGGEFSTEITIPNSAAVGSGPISIKATHTGVTIKKDVQGHVATTKRSPFARRPSVCALTQNSSLLLMEIPQACRVLSRS